MQQFAYRGIRKRSTRTLFGLPLLDIALGPDPEAGEMRGHARGIIAIGDIAKGGIAIGGIALGVVSFGGLAVGGLSLGGLAVGFAAAGGGAIGVVAVGGAAIGYYALGGFALGKHVVWAAERSPEAVDFFRRWLPFLPLK